MVERHTTFYKADELTYEELLRVPGIALALTLLALTSALLVAGLGREGRVAGLADGATQSQPGGGRGQEEHQQGQRRLGRRHVLHRVLASDPGVKYEHRA